MWWNLRLVGWLAEDKLRVGSRGLVTAWLESGVLWVGWGLLGASPGSRWKCWLHREGPRRSEGWLMFVSLPQLAKGPKDLNVGLDGLTLSLGP